MSKLTKTDFILYHPTFGCPKNVWIKWHMPEEYCNFEISAFEKSLGVMGNEVEELARGMFPDGFLIERRNEGAQDLTKKMMSERKPVIFQAVFATEKYLAATDVLKWNPEANAYDLYEIKMSSIDDEESEDNKPNKKRELQFEYDLAFQTNVAKACGVTFNKKYLVRLNKNYVRRGDLDFSNLFEITDKTEILSDTFLSVVQTEMNNALVYLSQKEIPKGNCPCYYSKGRSKHCTTFSISNPDVPEYSVHDLHKIGLSKKYLAELLGEGILKIEDVPEDERLKPKKPKKGEEPSKPRRLNQVRAHKSQKIITDLEGIKMELNSLQFPLYFLDYETYPTAVPPFDGYHPYQHIVFQYSLHVVRNNDSKPEHFECIELEGDPSEKIVKSLMEHIGDTGSVVSWYKHFENSRNRELAELLPQHADFLNSIIDRTYDLMDIVDNQHYVHPSFRGSASIKKVQPVLATSFDYKKLGVKNGTDAIEAYRQISKEEVVGKDADEKKKEMLEYCKYDTEVMYVIWDFFTKLVK